jgi:hypothetical protein
MSLFKVHVVEADMSGNIHEVVAKRDELGRSIAKLADRVNTPVFFHDYKDPVAGAPQILLECSDTFLDLVKKLPGFASTHEHAGLPTERKPAIKNYFLGKPAAPAKTPPKHKGPGF